MLDKLAAEGRAHLQLARLVAAQGHLFQISFAAAAAVDKQPPKADLLVAAHSTELHSLLWQVVPRLALQ